MKFHAYRNFTLYQIIRVQSKAGCMAAGHVIGNNKSMLVLASTNTLKRRKKSKKLISKQKIVQTAKDYSPFPMVQRIVTR